MITLDKSWGWWSRQWLIKFGVSPPLVAYVCFSCTRVGNPHLIYCQLPLCQHMPRLLFVFFFTWGTDGFIHVFTHSANCACSPTSERVLLLDEMSRITMSSMVINFSNWSVITIINNWNSSTDRRIFYHNLSPSSRIESHNSWKYLILLIKCFKKTGPKLFFSWYAEILQQVWPQSLLVYHTHSGQKHANDQHQPKQTHHRTPSAILMQWISPWPNHHLLGWFEKNANMYLVIWTNNYWFIYFFKKTC